MINLNISFQDYYFQIFILKQKLEICMLVFETYFYIKCILKFNYFKFIYSIYLICSWKLSSKSLSASSRTNILTLSVFIMFDSINCFILPVQIKCKEVLTKVNNSQMNNLILTKSRLVFPKLENHVELSI